MADDDLFQACADLLAAAETLVTGIKRRTVTVPPFVADRADQLTVFADPVGVWPTNFPGATRVDAAPELPQVTLVLSITRCAPPPGQDGMPTEAAETKAAQQLYGDSWRLWNGLRRLLAQGTVFTRPTVEYVGMVPYVASAANVDESGGVVGWQANVLCTIDGYGPV